MADSSSQLPLATQLRNLHEAVQVLIDHPSRMEVPAVERRRAHLITHTLVLDALRRGWKVTAIHPTRGRDLHDRPEDRWISPDLLQTDAGAAPTGIRVRMKQKSVPHALTPEEKRSQERHGYSRARKSDWVPTDVVRLEVRGSEFNVLTIDDTARTRADQKLGRAIERIQKNTEDAIALAERLRVQTAERALREEEIARAGARITRYAAWVSNLDEVHAEWSRLRSLREVITSMRAERPEAGSETEAFLSWAEGHIARAELSFALRSAGETPELGHAEWFAAKSPRG